MSENSLYKKKSLLLAKGFPVKVLRLKTTLVGFVIILVIVYNCIMFDLADITIQYNIPLRLV